MHVRRPPSPIPPTTPITSRTLRDHSTRQRRPRVFFLTWKTTTSNGYFFPGGGGGGADSRVAALSTCFCCRCRTISSALIPLVRKAFIVLSSPPISMPAARAELVKASSRCIQRRRKTKKASNVSANGPSTLRDPANVSRPWLC